ncbi:MAG: sigma-70 family RNA polymerase sigma factor [Spirochaetales bacterium]|nr:sigma-70 family RNA polymerase sigma factor [Spirochaetales bacterium]
MKPATHPDDAWVHSLPADQIVTRVLKQWGPRFALYIRLSGAKMAGLEAEDLLHEFALYVYANDARRLRSFQGLRGARFSTFLTQVFRRWFFRKLSQARNRRDIERGQKTGNFSLDPALIFQKKDMHLTLIRCMRRLNKADRALLEERFFQGKSLATIARERGIKTHAIYQRFSLALIALQNRLRKAGLGPEVLEEEHT